MGFRSVIMKKKLLLGIALCLGLTVTSFAQGGGPNNGRNHGNPDQTTEEPANEEPGAAAAEQPAHEDPGAAAQPRDERKDGGAAAQPTDNRRGESGEISIRFRTPWDNTTAIMSLNGADTYSMKILGKTEKYQTQRNRKTINVTKVHPDTCGWYKTSIEAPAQGANTNVLFRQTFGDEIYGNGGRGSTDFISLDSVIATGAKTIWIQPVPFPNGTPTIYTEFPSGSMGACYKKMPVMAFDWYHGNKGNYTETEHSGYNNAEKDIDPDFGGERYAAIQHAFAISNDFGSQGCLGSNQPVRGIVQETLGPNGVPVASTPLPTNCNATDHVNEWFLPQVLASDDKGNKYTNATCRDISLYMSDEGMWRAQYDQDNDSSLFILDDFRTLDEEGTIPNPFFDQANDYSNKRRNFGFTMKVQASFEYVPGQYFEFTGDDDVWVFINNRLVVDIGGQHSQEAGAVNLDTLGLVPGQTYPFHIFYVERHTTSSNFRMVTSIDLKTEASLLLQDLSTDETHLKYDIWQIVREQTLSCDFSNSMQAKDTARAPSNFNLVGGNLPAEGVYLDSAGTWFGGIKITNDMTGFEVDIDAIKAARALTPGQYCMRFNLQSDLTQGDEVWFEVGAYALPTIVYAKNNGEILGSMVNNQVTPIGEWAFQMYQVNVQYDEDWANYDDVLFINATDTLISFMDAEGNPINSVTLNAGKASFFIIAKGEVKGATLMVKGAGSANTAAWTNIDLLLPPVPLVDYAIMYDRDGDGRADSLYVKYTKSLVSKSHLDSLQFTFGETFPVTNKYNKAGDSAIVITADGGFGATVFTGKADTLYNGLMQTWFTFSDEGGKSTFPVTGDITDRVNPIITSAEVEITNHNTNLIITFSEGIADSSKQYYLDMFQYKCWRSGSIKDPIDPISVKKSKPNVWKLPFNGGMNDVVPAVGDSIRLVPGQAPLYLGSGAIAYDLNATAPHVNNPWVRLTGDQEVQVTSAPVATIDPANEKTVEIVTSPVATVPKLVTDMTKDVKEVVADYGTQGHLIGFDMAQIAADENAAVVADIENGKLSVDVLVAIETGTISVKKAKKQYGLSDATINAINDKTLTSNNIAAVKNGTAKIVSKENIFIHYKTSYFTSLGHYVNGESGTIACSDTIYNGDCLNNNGNLFLAWNMRASDKRLVGTGVYIARIEIKVKNGKKVVSEMERDMLWGVRRGKVNALDLADIMKQGGVNTKENKKRK